MKKIMILIIGLFLLIGCASQRGIQKSSNIEFSSYQSYEKQFISEFDTYLTHLVDKSYDRSTLKSTFDANLDSIVFTAFEADLPIIVQKVTANPKVNIDFVEQFISPYKPTELPYQQLQTAYYQELLLYWKIYLTSTEQLPKRVKPGEVDYAKTPIGAFVNTLKKFNSDRINKLKNIKMKEK